MSLAEDVRDIQLPISFQDLWTPARYKAFYGGRASAKSHSFATALLLQGGERPLRILCGREVQKSIRESVKQLLDDKIEDLGLEGSYNSLSNEIRGDNGTKFIFTGLSDHTIDTMKSYEGIDIFWGEEAQTFSARSLEILIPTIRKSGSELWFSWNPRHKSDPVDERFRSGIVPDDSIVRQVNHTDNPFMSTEATAERLFDRKTKPDRYSHIWEGDYEPQAVGAIWTRQNIADNRTTLERLAEIGVELERIVVAVDPAVSDTDTSDEHGITVQGKGTDGRGYLLEDGSIHGSPAQWATRAWSLHDKWEADAIVIERNQGGDMCRHTLRVERPKSEGGKIIEVTATRGKHVRAEPISALSEQGHVGYAGSFPELEGQLCLFTASGYNGERSPDRAEAFIWGMTELFPSILKKKPQPKSKKKPRNRRISWMGS